MRPGAPPAGGRKELLRFQRELGFGLFSRGRSAVLSLCLHALSLGEQKGKCIQKERVKKQRERRSSRQLEGGEEAASSSLLPTDVDLPTALSRVCFFLRSSFLSSSWPRLERDFRLSMFPVVWLSVAWTVDSIGTLGALVWGIGGDETTHRTRLSRLFLSSSKLGTRHPFRV